MQPRHTAALLRSVWLAILLGLFAVAFGRPDLLVLAAPFVAHAVWALAGRPAPFAEPEVSPRSVTIPEGDAVALGIRSPGSGGWLLGVAQWPLATNTRFDPETATAMGVRPEGEVGVTVEPERWGRYRVGPIRYALTDLSGAWRAEGGGAPVGITVRPAAGALEGGSGVAHPIGISGIHRSRHRGDGTDLADVREFAPGNRLKRINWRVTSRVGKLHVNSMLVERDTDVLIVVDTLADPALPDPDAPTSLDLTVRAVAAISRHYVEFGDRVAVHDLGRRIGSVRAGSGPRQAKAILTALARADRTAEPYQDGPGRGPTVLGGTLIFFCSPLLDRQVLDQLVRLRRMGGEVVAIDTMPEALGRAAQIPGYRAATGLGEGWSLRRLERDDLLMRLRDLGIPVTPWRGPASLATVLQSMEAARSLPRSRGGR